MNILRPYAKCRPMQTAAFGKIEEFSELPNE
jgi:hypothetical protein